MCKKVFTIVLLFSYLSIKSEDFLNFVFRIHEDPIQEQEYITIARQMRRRMHSYTCNHQSVYAPINFIHNHRACASWNVKNYWQATLNLFGRPYPKNQSVNLPSEYKCFAEDDKNQYYIHDVERYFIMEQWPLYDYPEFWKFIQHYPDYQQCILALHTIIQHDSSVRQQLSQQALQHIEVEAQKIMQQQQLQQALILQEQARTAIRQNYNNQSCELYRLNGEYQELQKL